MWSIHPTSVFDVKSVDGNSGISVFKTVTFIHCFACRYEEHQASEDEKRDLLLEIDLMKELGHHPNVVSMLACCTQGPNIGLIMDYCPLGDLRNFLRKHRLGVSYLAVVTYILRAHVAITEVFSRKLYLTLLRAQLTII